MEICKEAQALDKLLRVVERTNGRSCGPFGKVLVFCDDDGIDAKCMIPDHGIFGTGQTDVIDVLG